VKFAFISAGKNALSFDIRLTFETSNKLTLFYGQLMFYSGFTRYYGKTHVLIVVLTGKLMFLR
jgi:hypothetical protein